MNESNSSQDDVSQIKELTEENAKLINRIIELEKQVWQLKHAADSWGVLDL